MLRESIQTGSSLKETGVTSNINESAMYTANTATALVAASATYYPLITGASNGTLVKSITIKAIDDTTQGMIRIYHKNSSVYTILIDEIPIPAVNKSAIQPSFEITFNLDYYLKSGLTLHVTTEKDERFVVTAEGLDMSY